MSPQRKASKILAKTFFAQLKDSGYNSHQVIDIATELIELVTTDLRVDSKAVESVPQPEFRQSA